MSDTRSDPFAELFGDLPDAAPRTEQGSSGDDAVSRPASAAPVSAPTPVSAPAPASTASTPAVPGSRRAAREAAAAQQAAAPVMPEPTAEAAAPRGSGPYAPAAAAPHTPAPAARIPAPDGGPVTQPLDVDLDDHPWMFTDAAAAPAMPYSRGAAAAPREPAHPSTEHPSSTTTLEDLFADSGDDDDDNGGGPLPTNKRRKRRIGGWIALGVVLLVFGGIAAGGLWVWNTYEAQIRELMGWEEPADYADGQAHGEVFVTVSSGDTGQNISQTLYDSGVTMTPNAFYDYLIDTGQNPPFVPGVFKLQEQMTSAAALTALLDPANKMENTAQLREGLTVDASLPILAEATGLPVEDFQAAVASPADYGVTADSLEGWLFPATYTFDPGVTAPQVIQTLVDRTVKSLDDAGVSVDDRQRVLTIASIIQREARFEADFYKVSRVIENRLNPSNQETFGLLQMDSTAQYGYGENHDGTVSTSAEALEDDNPWNTYVHAGLPVGPISNPGDTAIDAAMHPVDGDWLYFVTVNLDTGETVFTNNLGDHNRAVAQWQAWCADHPDSGC